MGVHDHNTNGCEHNSTDSASCAEISSSQTQKTRETMETMDLSSNMNFTRDEHVHDTPSEVDEDDDSRNSDHDDEGILLLSIIFPDASREELEELHYSRIRSPAKDDVDDSSDRSDQDYVHKDDHEHEPPLRVGTTVVLKETAPQSAVKAPETSSSSNDMGQNDPNGINESRQHLRDHSTFPQQKPKEQKPKDEDQIQLPDDFLRIPQHQALKLQNRITGDMEWNTVANLERNVVRAHIEHDDEMRRKLYSAQSMVLTTVFSRDVYTGLGMQLREWNGHIFVNSLTCSNGNRIVDEEMYQAAVQSGLAWDEFGPAFKAGIKPGDQILGVNGLPFLRWDVQSTEPGGKPKALSSSEILASTAKVIRGIDTIVLHIHRGGRDEYNAAAQGTQRRGQPDQQLTLEQTSSKGDHQMDDDSLTTRSEMSEKDNGWQIVDDLPPKSPQKGKMRSTLLQDHIPLVHPLIRQFAKRGLAKSKKEQLRLAKDLQRLTSRAAMWRRNSYLRSASFRYDGHSYDGDFSRDKLLYPAMQQEYYWGSLGFDFIRQALSIHIVNTFIENDRLAYTIWILDIESGTEWYCPIRYFKDFVELRMATSHLNKSIEKLPFPNAAWLSGDETSLSQHIKDARCNQLEQFLRGLCTLVYSENLAKSTSEVALFVQTFLGCDSQIVEEPIEYAGFSTRFEGASVPNPLEENPRRFLEQAIQLYTYRLFLLPTFKELIARIIGDFKRRVIVIEERRIVNMRNSEYEKEKILVELTTIKHVFGNLWELIYQGCLEDVNAIASCPEFNALHSSLVGEKGIIFIESIFREKVREQIEIEVYVPLRSIISRLLVHGWRYDDKAIAYKVEILKQKSQSFLKIHNGHQSPSGWRSVIDILREGVGRSTLPCNKLKAIVDAGKEIGRLSKVEHPGGVSGNTILGADDFLPIFIYCVVNADIDRPCALCKSLRLCKSK